MEQHLRHLTKRDRAILEFVVRYRIGTEELVNKACFAERASSKNVARVLRRLTKRRLLRSHTVGKHLDYFTPTPRGYRVLGHSPRTPRRLTEQSLPVVFAVASYCVHNGLVRLTCREFAELYPELWRPGQRASSYVLIETPVGLKLEMLLIDRGGAARRIRARVRRAVAQRRGLPDFVALIQAGLFRINVLTGTVQQQARIQRQIAKESLDPIEVTTAVVPELADILLLRRT